jgi:predicted DNA-binding transcriptional regulator AlpA
MNENTTNTRPVRMLRITTVSERIGLSRSVIYVTVNAGRFPKPDPLNDKSAGWLSESVKDGRNLR